MFRQQVLASTSGQRTRALVFPTAYEHEKSQEPVIR
jgi:hypothetical protein